MVRKTNLFALIMLLISMLLLSSCSSLGPTYHSIRLGSITGQYKSDVSEGEVKKVILYLKESEVLKENEDLLFTLEKEPDEYRVLLDLKETEKLNLTESAVSLFMDLFGESTEKLSDEQLLSGLLRGIAIGLTEDVLNEYTEIRVVDNEQKRYRIYPPSFH